MTPVFLGLGANLGDRRRGLADAVRAIGTWATPGSLAVSRLYETAYVGSDKHQPPYLNACVGVLTGRSPQWLLSWSREIEQGCGREGKGDGRPRALDIDILLYGALALQEEGLEIPHPRLARRRFVLEPLADLDPGIRIPGLGVTVTDLLAQAGLLDQDVRCVQGNNWWEGVTV